MFLNNKYHRWYSQIVARDDATGYRECHHKIPRALGGKDRKDNIVFLSARKHFLAHWLLTKCTEGEARRAMFWAFACMTRNPSGQRNLQSWQYHRARESYRQAAVGRSSNFKGRRHSDESCRKMSEARKGKKLSEGHKANIAKGLQGKNCGWPTGKPRLMSEKQRAEYADRMRGNKYRLGSSPSEETRAKLSYASKGNKSKSGMIDSLDTKRRKRASQLQRPSWGKSGLKGVRAYGKGGKYLARLKVANRRMHLGVFDCPAAAHFAYVIAVDRFSLTTGG